MNGKIKNIFNQVANDIAGIFFYFLAFYACSFALSLFFESWKLFFNWPAMHISAFALGVLSLLSQKGIKIIGKGLPRRASVKEYVKTGFYQLRSFEKIFLIFLFLLKNSARISFRIAALSIKIILRIIRALARILIQKMRFFGWKRYAKAGLIAAISAYALYKGIEVASFFVLAYAMISILFIINGKIAAGIALAFLASCPFFLILKKESLAEAMAVYVYYFMVIAVFTQAREYFKDSGKTASPDLSTDVTS